MMIMLIHWTGKKNTFHLRGGRIRPMLIRQELELGFPSLIAQLSSGIAMMTFNAIILSLTGNTGVAAYGVIANLSLVVVAVYTGIAQGVQPLISYHYGKGADDQAIAMLRYAIQTMLVFSFCFYLLIFAFAGPIASVFNSENSLKLQQIAVTGMKIYFTSSAFVGYNVLLATYFTSVERVFPAHVLSILRGLILIVPVAFLLSAAGGMLGVWLTYPLTEALVAGLGRIIFKRQRKAMVLNS